MVAVWIEVDDDGDRPLGSGGIDDPPDVVLGEDANARRPTVRSAGPGGPRAAGPGRATPRPTRTGREPPPGARVRPAAAWSRSVDLPIPGSPPTRTSEPGTSPPPRTRSNSSIPSRRRGRSASAIAARPVGATRPGRRAGPPRVRPRAGSWTTVSTRLFHSPQAGHWPSQRRNDSAQDWQTKRLFGRAIAQAAGQAARLTAPRPACVARRGGCRGPPRDPCPR